jgi:hypothetical protein
MTSSSSVTPKGGMGLLSSRILHGESDLFSPKAENTKNPSKKTFKLTSKRANKVLTLSKAQPAFFEELHLLG